MPLQASFARRAPRMTRPPPPASRLSSIPKWPFSPLTAARAATASVRAHQQRLPGGQHRTSARPSCHVDSVQRPNPHALQHQLCLLIGYKSLPITNVSVIVLASSQLRRLTELMHPTEKVVPVPFATLRDSFSYFCLQNDM